MKYDELKGYLDKNMTIRQISAESHKGFSSIRHWMKKYGLKPNFANFKGGYVHDKQKVDKQGRRYCPKCEDYQSIDNFYSRRKNNCSGWCKVCIRKQTVERGRKLKLDCIEYKGGKCQKCGYSQCQAALDFHHRDPAKKDFSLCKKYGCRKISDRIKKELDKCDLLCANCHREEHWQLKIGREGLEPPTSTL